MDEKTIIKSKKYQSALVITALILTSLCIPILYFIVCSIIYGGYTMDEFLYTDGGAIIPKLLMPIFFVFTLWAVFFTEIVVTDKRVYGKTMFGKRVDLPLDSISSVGLSSLHGISVGTSSGRISFVLIMNNRDIHNSINDLLINRQKKNSEPTSPSVASSTSNADELKKFKELLDSGIITQEEFDAKKKQLLGL